MNTHNWTPDDYPEMFDKLPLDRQTFLLNWIEENIRPIQSFNTKHTSYGLKQRISSSDGKREYFYNGEFKGAMLKSGYKVKDPDALNWVFNISANSPIFKLPPLA